MLTIRENFIEIITGGKPDRFVKQFEYMRRANDPITAHCCAGCPRGGSRVNDWGVSVICPEELPGAYPVHDVKHIILKDITRFHEILHRPDPTAYPSVEWAQAEREAAELDRNQYFLTTAVHSGILEKIVTFICR